MRSHAKASSAGSTLRRANRLGRFFRGPLATRGACSDADGSGAPSHRSTRFAIGLLVAALALIAIAPNAMAITTRAKTASFGSDGTALTTFGHLHLFGGIDFNQEKDRLYVVDGSYNVPPIAIAAFDAPAHTPAGGAFPFTVTPDPVTNAGVAVDNTTSPSPSAGNIYYANTEPENKLYGFDSSGAGLGGNFPISLSWEPGGVAVDSSGNLYVSDGASQLVRKFDSAGNPLGAIDTSAQGAPGSIAFDSNDDLFFSAGDGVYKATAASAYSSVIKIPWSSEFFGRSPVAIAVDRTAHTLYIADANRVSAYKTDGTFLYEFGGGIHASNDENFQSIAVDEGTDTVYVSDDAIGIDQVHVFSPAQSYADATAAPTAATNLTDVSADIGATITDNNVLPTSWRLELSPNGGSNWFDIRMSSGSASGATAGGQSGVAVGGTAVGYVDRSEKDIDGNTINRNVDLDPNSEYEFRIVTNKGSSVTTEVASSPLSFKTVAPPPVVTDVGAVQVADVSARLVGTIDPRNSDTSYVFEYGPTPALGSSAGPLAIGGGTKPITVSQLISGLSPDTTYYFRLVATNPIGTTPSANETLHTRTDPPPPANSGSCGNEALRQAQSATFLPDCRAYEMVSPPDKNQGSAVGGTITYAAVNFARDGQGVAFCTNGALFGDPPPQQSFTCASYIAKRGPDGWTSKKPFPSYCPFGFDGTQKSFNAYLPRQSFDRVALEVPELESPCPLIDPAAPRPSTNLYREDLTTDPFSFDLLAPSNDGFKPWAGLFAGGSDDFSHVIYASYANQTADSPAQDSFLKLYDWEEEGEGDCLQPSGCLSLVSVDPSGVPFTTNSKLAGYSVRGGGAPVANTVSGNGERIYFQNAVNNEDFPAGGCDTAACDLYMREDGATTFHVAASECSVSCGMDFSFDRFLWANPAGEVALFVSCAKLTNESSDPRTCDEDLADETGMDAKLYRWDRGGAPGNRLIDLSVDHEPADGSQPKAVDLIGASTDGDIVYFVAGGQIVSGAPTGPGMKLYRWRWNGGSPSVDYLAPYLSAQPTGFVNNSSVSSGTATISNRILSDPNANRFHVRVTPDGKYLVIQTKLALDPVGDRDTDADLYRWEEAGGWLCVSCQLPGVPSAGHVSSIEPNLTFNALFHEYVGQEPEHTISDDGQRIFFSTPDALVPEDVNGVASGCPVANELLYDRLYSCQDVYEWHDGTVSLISSGTGSKPFVLMGATQSGEDVFFTTAERLVGWDADNGIDIYDAHVGGGYPEPPAQPPTCEGEACRGAGTSAPPSAGAGSAVFEGPGNPKATPPGRRSCPKGKRKVSRNGNVRCLKKGKGRTAKHNRRVGR